MRKFWPFVFFIFLVSSVQATTPTDVTGGLIAFSTGTATVTAATMQGKGIQANDIIVVAIESANETSASTMSANGGGNTDWNNATWTAVGAAVGTGTAAAAGSVGLRCWWLRFTSAMSIGSITLNDSGDHTGGRFIVVRGCITSGSPIVDYATQVNTGNGAELYAPQITFTQANSLAVLVGAEGKDDAAVTAGTYLNPNSAFDGAVTQSGTTTTNLGVGGGVNIADSPMTTPGSIPNTTTQYATWSSASTVNRCSVVFTLQGPTPTPTPTPGPSNFFWFYP